MEITQRKRYIIHVTKKKGVEITLIMTPPPKKKNFCKQLISKLCNFNSAVYKQNPSRKQAKKSNKDMNSIQPHHKYILTTSIFFSAYMIC